MASAPDPVSPRNKAPCPWAATHGHGFHNPHEEVQAMATGRLPSIEGQTERSIEEGFGPIDAHVKRHYHEHTERRSTRPRSELPVHLVYSLYIQCPDSDSGRTWGRWGRPGVGTHKCVTRFLPTAPDPKHPSPKSHPDSWRVRVSGCVLDRVASDDAGGRALLVRGGVR